MKCFENFSLKIKLVDPNAKMPTRARAGDAGLDLYSPCFKLLEAGKDVLIPLGFQVEFPEGFVMIIKEKSGRAMEWKSSCGASVVDSGYRGIVHVHLFNHSKNMDIQIMKGTKIAQAVIVPCWIGQPIQVDEINIDTERGTGGFGSTDKK